MQDSRIPCNPVLVDAQGAAQALGGISRRTVWLLVQAGDLVPVRIGRRVLFRVEDLEALAHSGCPRLNATSRARQAATHAGAPMGSPAGAACTAQQPEPDARETAVPLADQAAPESSVVVSTGETVEIADEVGGLE